MAGGDATRRLPELDVFRGMTVMLMILVNMPGSFAHVYPLLAHADWTGCTLADLVYPFFLFSVGFSGYLSARKSAGWADGARRGRILRRGALLFGCGVLLNLYPFYDVWQPLAWENVRAYYGEARLFGVLQRIAGAYCIAFLLCLRLRSGGRIAAAGALLLAASWAGFVLYQPEAPYAKADNVSRAVDLFFPGAAHCYQGEGLAFDPEGLYGTAAAAVSVMTGFVAGRFIAAADRPARGAAVRLLIGGGALATAGLLLARWIVISKPLWTASYTLYTSGLAAIVFAAWLWLLNGRQTAPGWARPFVAFGANPFFLFIVSQLFARSLGFPWLGGGEPTPEAWLWTHGFGSLALSPRFASLLSALVCVGLYGLLAEWLYRRRRLFKL